MRNASTRLLPKQLGTSLRPKPTYTINRWAGVLALSNLAREKPDARIAPFFSHCLQDSNAAVRKVAAYEAGPWLDPEHPNIAATILALALNGQDDRYNTALRALMPRLKELSVERALETDQAIAALAN